MLRRLLLKFVKYFLPILILSVLAVFWLYKKEHKKLISLQHEELSSTKELIVELLKPMMASLYYWGQYNFTKSDFDPEQNAHLEKRMGDFVIGMDSYYQFRLIDLSGKEVYRLNRRDDGNIVKSLILQDKANRDYFKETTDLKKDQIYLSPLNLNRENGVLELPFKPMIRGVVPIFDAGGTRLGIVVINFSANRFLDLLKKDNLYSFLLLDRYGNYLVNKDGMHEFAHLMPNGRNVTFYEEHPYLADTLRSTESTSLFRNGDLWVKTELDFKKELAQTPLFQNRFADIKTNNKWVLIKHLDSEILNAKLKSEIITIFLINLLAIMVIFCLSYLEAKSDTAKKKYMQALELINRELEDKSTELEHKNNTLAATQHKLELRNAQLLEYNNIVAHNLRAPTTSVSALVSMLNESKDYEEAKTYFPKLEKITHAINTLVDDLLIYVRILNDDDRVDTENIALEPMIEATLDLYIETLDKETIEVKIDFGAWKELIFSKIYLQSILQNLISNAIKYRDPNSKSVIFIRTQWENRQKVLVVEDNGVGVDLDRYGQDIFKLYKRFHRGLSGKGMGLFLVKTQLESLNAHIEVSSKLGVGTTFKIIFDSYE